ncbi:MAG: DNA repair protein RecO [Clostridiales bacterium]|nr:DNA repair protein RecO [Clostridiales bacterium]
MPSRRKGWKGMRQVVHGIVLREVAYKESDKILTVLTDKNGQMTVSARGGRKKGGGLCAAAPLLVWSGMTRSEYPGRRTLSEAATEREFRRVRSDLERLALGSYFAELTELLTEEGLPNEEMLALLLNSLYVMEATDRPLPLVKATFELRAMCISGYRPMLERCAVCGRGQPEEPALQLRSGLLHCRRCPLPTADGVSAALDGASLAAMRHVAGCEKKKLFSYRLSPEAQTRMNRVCESFLLTQMERGFRTLEFYRQVAPQDEPIS